MDIAFDSQTSINKSQTETYMSFRSAVPKPSHEDAHLRHILRFYMARAMLERGKADVGILPKLRVGEKTIQVDVVAGVPGQLTLSICEPGSVTPETEEILDLLKEVDGLDVFIVHSQYGKPGNILTRFMEQLEAKKFHLLAVVPPPFDDVYEYDIWMFETTFRNLLESN